MRYSIFIFVAGGALLGCNGGSDTDSVPTTESAAVLDPGSAAATAAAVRDTIEGMSNRTHTESSTALTIRGSDARDPGPRDTMGDSGGHLDGLTPAQVYAFEVGKEDFNEAEEADEGLGPTFNLDSCGGCHSQPAIGGTSPRVNPQMAMAIGPNKVPPFITANGPVREARFVRNPDGSPDGGVHGLFTVTGRAGAESCVLAQPNFAAELQRNNVIFRIPKPLFGAGLIETIPTARS